MSDNGDEGDKTGLRDEGLGQFMVQVYEDMG